jgi:hypothetical protein
VAAEAAGDVEAVDPQHAVRGGPAADPQAARLAALEEPPDPAGDRHPGHVGHAVQGERVVRADLVVAGAEPAASRPVCLARSEDERGERVLGHVAQRELHRRERPSADPRVPGKR